MTEDSNKQILQIFYPGPIHIADSLKETDTFRSVIELGTDQQDIYRFNGINSTEIPEQFSSGFYERAEPYIDKMAHLLFISHWNEMIQRCGDVILQINDEKDALVKLASRIKRRCKDALDRGPTKHEIEEVKGVIRRTCQIEREQMNPDSHIPFKNGNLNLKTWKLEPATPELFFTYQIAGNYSEKTRSINETPKFRDFLYELFESRHIPTVLDYMSYTVFPGFPSHKVLGIFGPPRVGKGTLIRLNQLILNDAGVMIINLSKLLIPDNRFALQGIQGKNLLIDPEIKRDFKRSTDYHNVNTLFGGDTLQIEEKGKTPFNYRSKGKGIFAGNIPLFFTDNAAFLSRFLIVPTKNRREREPIPDLEKEIFEAEGDKIISLLMGRLKSLIYRNFRFSNQMSDDYYAALWETLTDSVGIFMDEQLEQDENGGYIRVDDLYLYFKSFCEARGIPMVKKQTFTYRIGKQYQKKKIRVKEMQKDKLFYAFTGCRHLLSPKIKLSKSIPQEIQKSLDEPDLDDLDPMIYNKNDQERDDENRRAFGF